MPSTLVSVEEATKELTDNNSLLHRALLFVWITEIWNIGELVIGLWAGFQTASIALVAFGLDSAIEVFAGAVAIWSLRKLGSQKEQEAKQKKAVRLLGVTFFLLSIYIAIQSSASLLGWAEEPRESLIGIVLVIATAASMTILYRVKNNMAKKLGSKVLRKEAVENLVCDLQDLTVLAGLGLNFLFGWWWADPIGAFLLIPFLIREGLESFRGEED